MLVATAVDVTAVIAVDVTAAVVVILVLTLVRHRCVFMALAVATPACVSLALKKDRLSLIRLTPSNR